MRNLAIALALVVLVPACGGSLVREYEEGAVTPYARSVLAAAGAEAGTAREPVASEPGMDEARAALDRLAAEWKEKAKRGAADPAALGFVLAGEPTKKDLEGELTPEIVFAAAFAMSPAIRSARESFKATVEQFDQVAYLDAILRQYSSFTKDLNLRAGASRQKERLEESFPFPGSLALKSRIVSEDARAAEERLEQTVRSELVAAGQAYYGYAYAGEAIPIVTENIELLRGIVGIAESKYGVGKAKQAVVLKAFVEIATLEDLLVTLRERQATVRAKISSILGLAADFPLGPPRSESAVAAPADPAPLFPLAARERQEILALRAKIRRSEALIELAETKAYPDLSIGYSRFQERAGTRVGGARMMDPFEEDPARKPSVWFGETASFITEMRSRLESMNRALEDLEAQVAYEVKDAWFKWDAASRQEKLYTASLLPQAEQAYQVLESGWQEGVADFLDALDAQRTWLRFRLEHRAAVRETNVLHLALLDALGTGIPKAKSGDR